jgi:CubicO group peptidase (beta-lactamase class C family)
MTSINAAVAAKTVCSGVFVSKRDPAEILRDDLGVDPDLAIKSGALKIRQQPPAVIMDQGTGPQEAVYRTGLGCTLLAGRSEDDIYKQFSEPATAVEHNASAAWPDGDAPISLAPSDADASALEAALTYAFTEPNTMAPAVDGKPAEKNIRGSRAVAVVHHGKLIAEKYAAPYDANTPLTGFSMTKSVTGTLTGILVSDGKLKVSMTPHVPEWPEGDPRHQITLDELMHMSAGLKFVEEYTIPPSPVDVMLMLYDTPDSAHYAAVEPQVDPPGAVWKYSSGTTNIISRIQEEAVGSLKDYLELPRARLFDPIGASSFVMEPDAAGTLVGSTFSFATARDWAKLGQLYLNDGMWKGKRVLPEGWAKYVSTPAPKAPHGRYGAQFWLNLGDPDTHAGRSWPSAPPDAYGMIGYLGQSVMIIPSQDLVVVRLGLTTPNPPDPGAAESEAFSLDRFLSLVLKALPQEPAKASPRKS